ncbi:type III-B CRISPR module-associated protein Cmr5 [Chitinilyticum piscinae]|uniref:CRISPR type III-B/RAMP module-associated protein Cmr5 n=1 Tax=Chitinilyticum piscinae TaxID=2866724 RepID=A0A8J7KGX2_9NEIS|nr:type III-B CRISPR module-associated protein Cmr5 [Chitinilyticum piscinae]MBE9610824.1 type III-B CRISPR module-associated protein Cmr5 [Chitinilyticum piscinae]
MQTLQQLRAKHALQKVQELVPLREGDKHKARASELPFMIHANGLGQAAAFFRSKDKDGYPEVYAVLDSWLRSEGRPFSGKPDLLTAITTCDMHTYRLAQAEAMHYMDWVKKFAKAYL